MQQLVFVGGAPGVGKSATCDRLYQSLPESIWLDGDDLWCRMNPFRVNTVTTAMVEKNIGAVLRNYLDTRFQYVILSWVLHHPGIVDRILNYLGDATYAFSWVTLVCDEAVLRHRWSERSDDGTFERAIERLKQTRHLERSRIIDTTDMTIEEVSRTIVHHVTETDY